jgi:hypothetical protein
MAENKVLDNIAVLGDLNPTIHDRECAAAKLDKSSLLGRIHDLSNLPRDWNGYGAVPIDPDIIQVAERIVSEMPNELVAAPQVVPMTRGRLQLEWHRDDRSRELEFESAEFVPSLKCDASAGIEEEDVIPIQQQGKILDLLRWFSAK